MVRDRAGGFVATEFVVGIALLLVPVTLLAASIPTWVERRHAATVAARDATVLAAETFPAGRDTGAAVAEIVAANYGIHPDDITVRLFDDGTRGGQVRAVVTIAMPALTVPLIGSVGRWTLTTTYALRIDDYRGRT
jgi:hypothetical protein